MILDRCNVELGIQKIISTKYDLGRYLGTSRLRHPEVAHGRVGIAHEPIRFTLVRASSPQVAERINITLNEDIFLHIISRLQLLSLLCNVDIDILYCSIKFI